MADGETGDDSGALDLVALVAAFGRWRELGDAAGPAADAARQKVDRLLAKLDDNPGAWNALKEQIGQTDDRLLLDLMRYSLVRSRDQIKVMARDLEMLPDNSAGLVEREPPPADPAQPPARRKRRRERDR